MWYSDKGFSHKSVTIIMCCFKSICYVLIHISLHLKCKQILSAGKCIYLFKILL